MKEIINSMPTATLVFIIAYCSISLVNLFFCFFEMEKPRKITKPFCIACLLVAIIVWVPQYPLIYLGVLFGLIGDILLIWKAKSKFFILGLVAFLIGHVLYIAQGLVLFGDRVPTTFYVIVLFFLVLYNVLCIHITKRLTKSEKIGYAGDLYFSALIFAIAIFFAIYSLDTSKYLILVALGMLAFLASDLTIGFAKFIRKFIRQEFFIMSLYLLAQLMVAVGFALTVTSI